MPMEARNAIPIPYIIIPGGGKGTGTSGEVYNPREISGIGGIRVRVPGIRIVHSAWVQTKGGGWVCLVDSTLPSIDNTFDFGVFTETTLASGVIQGPLVELAPNSTDFSGQEYYYIAFCE
jgi:hypothetical protein